MGLLAGFTNPLTSLAGFEQASTLFTIADIINLAHREAPTYLICDSSFDIECRIIIVCIWYVAITLSLRIIEMRNITIHMAF